MTEPRDPGRTRGDAARPQVVGGLMSGTSMDGVDTALLEVEAPNDGPGLPGWRLVAFRTSPYSDAQVEEIRRALHGGPEDACRLHAWLGEWLAGALLETCREAGVAPEGVAAVGSHGHTLWHRPPTGTERGASLQVGCPGTLAERTGIPVVSDLRGRDLAAGGQGAPLVPWPDRVLFTHPDRARAVQNLGGMGNVTWLPPGRAEGGADAVVAFDTGPGVALLDRAAELATAGRERCDRDGRLAARGEVDEALLERLLERPFFHRPPPRSTGREEFGDALVADISQDLEPGGEEEWTGLLATLTALTARSVAEGYRRWLAPRKVDEVLLTGGGARNPELVRRIRRELHPTPVRTGGELPLDPDAREAAAFALLAWAHLHGVTGNVPGATGARGARVLGSLTPGRGAERPGTQDVPAGGGRR